LVCASEEDNRQGALGAPQNARRKREALRMCAEQFLCFLATSGAPQGALATNPLHARRRRRTRKNTAAQNASINAPREFDVTPTA
jgi:hypothetical protein